MTPFYYESHIAIDPVFDEKLEQFRMLCADHRFMVADFLMQKRKHDRPERSASDLFCTGRSKSFEDLQKRMFDLTHLLISNGFKVWRYKIEQTLVDSRYDDKQFPLDRAALPEKERNPKDPTEFPADGRDD